MDNPIRLPCALCGQSGYNLRTRNVQELTMPTRQTTVAIVYDFDGTLAPGNMQEHQFIPDIGMEAAAFWEEVDTLSQRHQADGILMYMYMMLQKARGRVPVRQQDFREMGKGIRLFAGVAGWFGRIAQYGVSQGVNVEHYIVSSGNSEIIAGSEIAGNFKRIYASKFMFDESGVASWPALAINYTNKTQYLFRINKGAHDLSDDSKINAVVPKNERPIPFENMVYIGDGSTDVPCFRVVKDEGGLSIAVYSPNAPDAPADAAQFLRAGRVHHAVPADYTEGGKLDTVVKQKIAEVAARKTPPAR